MHKYITFSPYFYQAHTVKNGKFEVKCRWKDINKSATWVDMFSLAIQDPIPILKYATDKHILSQKPFSYLANYCNGDSPSDLARAFKAKVRPNMKKYKFGIQVPMGVKQAFQLDIENGNTYWKDAIGVELKQLDEYHVFYVLGLEEQIPDGYQRIPYHFVFDVKFDLRRKARLVAGGNWTELEKEDIYSGVVGMDTIRLGIFVGELNDLSCCAADVGNAYLYGTTLEKVYIIAGPEFGELEGRILIIVKSLYGLKSSAARWHECLSQKLRSMGFRNSKADHNLWIIEVDDHYEYIATYVDDLMVWSKNPMKWIDILQQDYKLKGIGRPEYYLGGNFIELNEHWSSENVRLALSAETYINNIIPKFEILFGQTLSTSYKTPMLEDYHPEVDDSAFCSDDDSSKYKSIIGSLNWLITLGRFDVHFATSSLSCFSMKPREGHYKAAKRVLAYLKACCKGKIIYDTGYPDHSQYDCIDQDWSEIYPDAEEEIPQDMPTPKGRKVRMTIYVDANHGHDLITRRSVTGIIVYLNNTPIRWVCKRQKTVETATYGSELVAARIATELVMEVRYQLRMLGVPLEGPGLLLGDNMSVVLNTTVPSSVLKKKHNALAYGRVCEAIAAKIIRFAHIKSEDNQADVLTKSLGNEKFWKIVKSSLFRTPLVSKGSVP